MSQGADPERSEGVRRPPAWALVSSTAAMVFPVAGWTIAQAVQPPGYDAARETISALARHGLDHRWIMTLGLTGLGVAHIVTACGLTALRRSSRFVLAAGGVSTLVVAVFAEPYRGSSTAHVAAATTGFIVLALWPATTATSRAHAPATIRPVAAFGASAVSIGLLLWVGATDSAGLLGLAERLLVYEQALWPFVVVVTLRRGRTATLSS